MGGAPIYKGRDAHGLAQGRRSRILLSLGVFMTNATIFIRYWSRLRVKFKFSDDHPLDFFLLKIPGAKKSLISHNYQNVNYRIRFRRRTSHEPN